MKVSVIIPTYQRPSLLQETIYSVFNQTLLPDEILIGDDSTDDRTEKLVNEIKSAEPTVPIHYFHHHPSLKEGANVEFLYTHAGGDLVLHLHDDDPVFPKCIEVLKQPLVENESVAASFGLQRLIDDNGNLLRDADQVNAVYFRTPERAGIVDGFMAGAVSMFPNNGFMIRKRIAVDIGYSGKGRAGLATDFYFGFRLGQLGMPFYFVHDYTAYCRITTGSLSRTGVSDNAYQSVKILLEDCPPEKFGPELNISIRNRIPIAITIAALKKERITALKWLFSKYYRSKLFSLRGIKRLLLILKP